MDWLRAVMQFFLEAKLNCKNAMSQITTIYYKTKENPFSNLSPVPIRVNRDGTPRDYVIRNASGQVVYSFDEADIRNSEDSENSENEENESYISSESSEESFEEIVKEIAYEKDRLQERKELNRKHLNNDMIIGIVISIVLLSLLSLLIYGAISGHKQIRENEKNQLNEVKNTYSAWIKMTGKTNVTFEEFCILKKNNLLNPEKPN